MAVSRMKQTGNHRRYLEEYGAIEALTPNTPSAGGGGDNTSETVAPTTSATPIRSSSATRGGPDNASASAAAPSTPHHHHSSPPQQQKHILQHYLEICSNREWYNGIVVYWNGVCIAQLGKYLVR